MGYNVEFSNNPEIIVCGSILGLNRYKHTNTKIWGAGFHVDEDIIFSRNPNFYYAVRGKLTLKKLNFNLNIALGDPGLLLSVFFKPNTKKKYNICIVSHYIDYKWFIKNYGDKYFIINMGNNNIEDIANSINQCKFIFSSSLHGIIFSHSLGIPAVHLENKILTSKSNFKFKDYYSILDIPYIKEDLKKNNFDIIIKKYEKNKNKFLPKYEIIREIQNNLLSSFPYQIMNNIICTFIKIENQYLNDWCKYHINLGFDNIYIYNNDSINGYIGDYLDNSIKNKVHIIKINNKKLQKKDLYSIFYNLFKFNFKWCAFIDIDEFIVLTKWSNISHFLNEEYFNNIFILRLNNYIYKTGNRIEKLNKLSKSKYFKNRILENNYKNQTKPIVKGSLNDIYFKLDLNSNINPQISSELNLINKTITSEKEMYYNSSNNKELAYIIKYIHNEK